MQPAEERLRADLAAISLAAPRLPFCNNVDATRVTTADAVRDGLARQVSRTVRWTELVRGMIAEQHVTTVVEVGPGTVLSGLVQPHRPHRRAPRRQRRRLARRRPRPLRRLTPFSVASTRRAGQAGARCSAFSLPRLCRARDGSRRRRGHVSTGRRHVDADPGDGRAGSAQQRGAFRCAGRTVLRRRARDARGDVRARPSSAIPLHRRHARANAPGCARAAGCTASRSRTAKKRQAGSRHAGRCSWTRASARKRSCGRPTGAC